MQKVKLAVWGITNTIWESIKDNLDPRRTEICFFIDKNADATLEFGNRYPIYSAIEQVSEQLNEVDYILVTAYSGFGQIRNTLISMGVCKEKIQIYVTPRLVTYDLGDLSESNKELVETIYFEPKKRWEDVEKYRHDYAAYKKSVCVEENSERWYERGPLISHACGGFVNGERIMYSNSKEALRYSFAKGFRLIECDILGIEKGEVVLAHDFYRFYEAQEKKYTMQSLRDMLSELVCHPDSQMLVDVKWGMIEEYKFYVSEIKRTICEVATNAMQIDRLMKQIVMEVYDEESIRCAQDQGFDVFFTQYRNEDMENFFRVATLCGKYQVGAVGYDVNYIRKWSKGISVLKEKRIKIFAFSTDSTDIYRELRNIGVDGVFTNYLTYDDV